MTAAAATDLRVLVVEDDDDMRAAVVGVLRHAGYPVEQAATLGAALVRLERGLLPQAVVLDLKLPDAMGGLLLRRIRRENLPVKVAVVTGYPDAAAHPYLERFPPDRVFTKPVDLAELVRWLESLE